MCSGKPECDAPCGREAHFVRVKDGFRFTVRETLDFTNAAAFDFTAPKARFHYWSIRIFQV